MREGVEQVCCDARSPHDSGSADAQLCQPAFCRQLTTEFVEHALAHLAGQVQVCLGDGEGDVIAAALMGGLNDQIHIDAGVRQGFEQTGSDARLIGDVGEGQERLAIHFLRSIHRTAQLQPAVTDRTGGAAGEPGAWRIAPARANHQVDTVIPCDLHSPWMQNRGTEAGQLQHLVATDRFHQLGIRHFAWVGAEHSRNIGVDLAGISTECRGQCHCRGVGAAPPQGCDLVDSIAAGAGALEAGHHHDLPLIQAGADPVGADAQDAGTAVGGFGGDAHLRTGHRDGGHTE